MIFIFKKLASGLKKDLTGANRGETTENFNNVINIDGGNVQNLDELNENLTRGNNRLDDHSNNVNKKEPVNDKYKKFQDEV